MEAMPRNRVGSKKVVVAGLAVAALVAGTAIYLVARDGAHFYWFTESKDFGKTWED
jgi:hypothetical protein